MNIQDTLLLPWAIKPDHLNRMKDILDAHLRGPKLNLKDIEMKILAAPGGSPKERNYEIKDGIAIIPIVGPIAKNPDIFDRVIFGMVSSSQIRDDFAKAMSDNRVEGVVLYVDSPGGTVDGTQELARQIFETKTKPVYVYSDGMIASALMWIGSAGDGIYISSETVEAGSIGVYMEHHDYSEMNKRAGLTITEIIAGKYKAMAPPHKPLSTEGKEYYQAQIDYLYSIFIDDVAEFRGITTEQALGMADGKIFIGQQAIDIGLVAGIATMDEVIQIAKSGGDRKTNPEMQSASGMKQRGNKLEGGNNMPMTIEMFRSEHGDLYKQVFELGKKSEAEAHEQALKSAQEEGAKKELDRIKSVQAQLLPGHEALVEELMFDGKTSKDEAAAKIIQAEKDKSAKHLESLKNKGKGLNIPPASGGMGDGESGSGGETAKEQFDAKVSAQMQENKCTRAGAVKAIIKAEPDLHEQYIKEINRR